MVPSINGKSVPLYIINKKIKMSDFRNYVTLVGSMGNNAKVTKFDNGNAVARFNLATHKMVRKNDGKYVSQVQWHKVFAWGNLAQFVETYGEQGKKVAIHGRLINRTYLSNEGTQLSSTEVELKQIIGL